MVCVLVLLFRLRGCRDPPLGLSCLLPLYRVSPFTLDQFIEIWCRGALDDGSGDSPALTRGLSLIDAVEMSRTCSRSLITRATSEKRKSAVRFAVRSCRFTNKLTSSSTRAK